MEKWVLLRKGADFDRISETFHISRRIASLIRNKELVTDAEIDRYLNGTITDLYDGMLMKDMDKAVQILKEKIEDGKRIRVIGDYDIDGIQATYILLQGLEYLGADVDSDIPHRMTDGYGLNIELVKRAARAGVDTIVTCDNGIAAADEIEYANEIGLTMIVTDHHEVPYDETENGRSYRLPRAQAVVDPKQTDCPYPFKGLCGAAVAYKLVEALCEVCGRDVCELDYLMENVAFATVGDVMDLVDENRIFVKQGLEMMKRTKSPGMRALMSVTGVEPKNLSAYHFGFVLGPCINATGRLDTAKRALELLRADDEFEVLRIAAELKRLNDERKDMTERAVGEALEMIETGRLKQDKVLVVFLPDCHESLAGIVAGRIRERYYKPVFVITRGAEGLKGSGRSIESWHMYEGLNRVRELLIKFGGHAMAAGLSLEEENLETFRRKLNETSGITEEDLTEKVVIDMQLPFRAVTEDFIEELNVLEPFGKGNSKPVFAQNHVLIRKIEICGKAGNSLRMIVSDDDGGVGTAMLFNSAEVFLDYIRQKYSETEVNAAFDGNGRSIYVTLTYYPKINEYRGSSSVQFEVKKYK